MNSALENMKLRAAYRMKDDNETAKKYWEDYKKGVFPHVEQEKPNKTVFPHREDK